MQAKQVKVIQPRVQVDFDKETLEIKKKKVCAYVRVSTDNEEQKTSFQAQYDEYLKVITSNPEYEFIGIFAYEGISGTSTKNRKQFNEMIKRAHDGEIDLIITKSISRFARNTVDCLNHVRDLRAIGVEVFFESDNLSSLDPKVEFTLTIMSSIAQEEARHTSENVKWNVKRRFENGVPIVNHKRFLGYTKDKKGGNLIIVPEEAETVRKVFELYINGWGPDKICRYMMEHNILTGAGRKKWINSTVTSILKNDKYTGDLIQQKSITVDYLTHKRVKNVDLAPMYHVENNHPAIISKETFRLAQQVRAEKAKTRIGENTNLHKYAARYPYSAFIICAECGRTLKRRYWNYGTSAQRVMQQCGSYIDGKANCQAKAIPQDLIEGATIKMINEVFIDNIDVVKTIKSIIKKNVVVTDEEKSIDELLNRNQELQTMISNLIDMKLKNTEMPEATYKQKYYEYTEEITNNELMIKKLEADMLRTYDTKSRIELINSELKKQSEHLTELNTELFHSFIFKMISVSPEEIVFCIAGKKNYNDNEFSEKRHEFLKNEPLAVGTYFNEKLSRNINYRVIVV